MKEFLYKVVEIIAILHEKIMGINDAHANAFTDKELHFLVMGVLGMGMIFVVYPFFKKLAQTNHVMVIAWIYVFTLILVIAFAIEIGQGFTGTGNMDFADIVFGVIGFFVMFAIFAVIRGVYHLICRLLKRWDEKIENS